MIRDKGGKAIKLRAVRPNIGIQASYRRKLLALINEMQASYVWWLRAQFREAPPRMAQDEEPVRYPRAPSWSISDNFTGVSESLGGTSTSGEFKWMAYIDGKPLRGPGGVGRRFKTAEAAERAIRQTIKDPASELKDELRKLGIRWSKQFDEAAPKLAEYFAKSAANRSDAALRAILRKGGFSVRFQITPAMRDVMGATVNENVALIRSIASEYHTQVEGLVMRSVTEGRDLSFLTKELQARYGITRRRAEFIARDQNNKSTAMLSRARHLEIGLDDATWLHSGGGRHPRPTHVKKSGGKFSLRDGWLDPAINKRIWPGTEPNCFPGDTIVRLESLPIRLWRSFFNGPMVYVEVGADLLKGTPNHPILTSHGWLPLNKINCGDEIVCMLRNEWKIVHDDERYGVTTFADLFEAGSIIGINVCRNGRSFNFHGDVPDGQVDEIILIDDDLPANANFVVKNSGDFTLSETDAMSQGVGLRSGFHVSAPNSSRLRNDALALFGVGVSKSDEISFAAVARNDSGALKNVSDIAGGMTWSAEMGRDGSRTHALAVKLNDLITQSAPVAPTVDFEPFLPELFAQFVRAASNRKSRVFEFGTSLYEFRRVSNKSIRNFSGHVFTMQTATGLYSASSAYVQAKNCRCVFSPLVKGFS